MAIGTATALLGGALVGGATSMIGASQSAKAAERASGAQLSAQEQQLEYLKEREAIPQQYREEAIQRLGGIYGLGEDQAARREFIAGLRQDPFYEQLRQEGEEAVLRGASATGGLRSGAASEALAGVNQDLLRGLYQEQVAGLGGLAGLPSMAPQIAGVMGQMGATQAAGITGAAQARQQGLQSLTDIGLSALGTGIKTGVI